MLTITDFDLVTSSRRPLLRLMVYLLREQRVQEFAFTPLDEIENIFHQSILILIRHPGNIVQYVSSIVLDQEFVPSRLEIGIGRKHIGALDE